MKEFVRQRNLREPEEAWETSEEPALVSFIVLFYIISDMCDHGVKARLYALRDSSRTIHEQHKRIRRRIRRLYRFASGTEFFDEIKGRESPQISQAVSLRIELYRINGERIANNVQNSF